MSTEAEKQGVTVNPAEVALEAVKVRQRVKAAHVQPSSPGAQPRVKADGTPAKKKAPAKKASANK